MTLENFSTSQSHSDLPAIVFFPLLYYDWSHSIVYNFRAYDK